MIRAQGSDQSPYSHHKVSGNGKLLFSIVAVSKGTYIHPEDEVAPLIPIDLELLGLYHYLESDKPVEDQIEAFDKAISKWEWDFLALDFERIGNKHLDGNFAKMAKIFIDHFINKYGKPVLLYTSPSVIQEWMLPFGQTWYQTYDLWIAQWPYNEAVYGPQSILKEVPLLPEKWNPRLPAGAVIWKAWQYSADGNEQGVIFGCVGNRDLDLCVFNGTIDEMKIWAKKEVAPLPPPPPPPNCQKYITGLEEIRDTTNKVLG